MSNNNNRSSLLLGIILAIFFVTQAVAQNNAPNLWDTDNEWAEDPPGRNWGSTSSVYPDSDGRHIWVGERCGANGNCFDTPDLQPILKFNTEGEVVDSRLDELQCCRCRSTDASQERRCPPWLL